MKNNQLIHQFHLGQNIDVKDTAKKWVNGQIIFIQANQLYIHYSGWSPKFDQKINISSDRILPQWEPGKELKINNRVDAFHPFTGWLQARIIQIQYNNQGGSKKVKVHYFNYHPKYDRWIDPSDPQQIDIIGSRSKAYGIGKSRSKTKSKALTLSQITKKILQLKIKYMIQQLDKQDYVIHNTAGDGNCLFRSISHQLYGCQDYHHQIRIICMRYIKSEKHFFQAYITENIDNYIQEKSKLGTWGDDVEIQALSQIYGRPIEIYATSSKPLRTFHEDNQHKIEPIRLAYVGYSHYNSIKPRSRANIGLLETQFGEYESLFSNEYQIRNSDYNLIRHRQFFSRTNGIDYALQQNVNASQAKNENFDELILQLENNQMNKVIQISQTQNILEQIEKSEMREVQYKIQEELIQQELRKIEEREMEIARQLSKKIKKDPSVDRPNWFGDLLCQGFREEQILFAIEVNGYDADLVQNFLLDNM